MLFTYNNKARKNLHPTLIVYKPTQNIYTLDHLATKETTTHSKGMISYQLLFFFTTTH